LYRLPIRVEIRIKGVRVSFRVGVKVDIRFSVQIEVGVSVKVNVGCGYG